MREIMVVYADESTGTVAASRLDALITSGRIKSFLRAEGWVRVGIDPIRRIKCKGRERRKNVLDPVRRIGG